MSLPFVQAKFYSRGGRNPLHTYAVTNHMAEGAGTVHYLSTQGSVANNNSSTLVVELTGRVVQMVRAGDMDHSLHVAYDPDDRDAPNFGLYSLAAAAAVLSPAGLGSLSNFENVLPFIVSIEWEGFAGPNTWGHGANPAGGLNAAQLAAARSIVLPWLKATFPNLRGALGHRDFQDYKACPGGSASIRELFTILGGHGVWPTKPTPPPPPPPPEEDMAIAVALDATKGTAPDLAAFALAKVKGAGHDLYPVGHNGPPLFNVPDGRDLGLVQKGTIVGDVPAWALGRERCVQTNIAGKPYLALEVDVALSPAPSVTADAVRAALAHVVAPAQAVLTAIQEATPR